MPFPYKFLRKWWDRKVPYHAGHAVRRARFHLGRHWQRVAPPMRGRIVCHILDFDRDPALAHQIRFLAERDVRTFRVYTDRPDHVNALLAEGLLPPSHGLAVVTGVPRDKVWRQIDLYNWSQSHDKWSLVLNAGEYLLYPYFETRTLTDLCQFLADEHRRTLYCVTLDAYRVDGGEQPLVAGEDGWRFDRCGYDFTYAVRWDTDRWYGGFLQRFPDSLATFGRQHISRVPLLKIGKKSMYAASLIFAYPPKVNNVSSPMHLSPTGCIVSASAYRHWNWVQWRSNRPYETAKLASAPAADLTWRHEDLAVGGFLNMGQWL